MPHAIFGIASLGFAILGFGTIAMTNYRLPLERVGVDRRLLCAAGSGCFRPGTISSNFRRIESRQEAAGRGPMATPAA